MTTESLKPWTYLTRNGRRYVTRHTPRGRVYCDCGEKLDYDYGSIRWQCKTEDLCPKCAGRQAAERALEAVRKHREPAP